MFPSTSIFITISGLMFAIGAAGFLLRKNVLVMFMCIELMLNAVNLGFVGFAKSFEDISGQVLVFFVMLAAAVEVVVGLSIIVAVYRRKESMNADTYSELRG
jgi:NADH-quinone oxidoreductase subunit K